MSFILSCPNCGPRAVDEYAYGGEVTERATSSDDERALFHYLYFRTNTGGDQQPYTVKSGDNLSKIAKHFYGNANKYTEIAKANNISNPDLIKVGQQLNLPAL